MNAKLLYEKHYKEDCDGLLDWCEQIYQDNFRDMFTKIDEFYEKLHSGELTDDLQKISENDLGYILVDLPMELYKASEPLNKLRAEREYFKLKSKTIEVDVTDEILERNKDRIVDDEYIESMIKSSLLYATAENKLMIAAHDCVIKRVENQISFCKELIMGCKKVWDSRKKSEDINPVGEVDIPEYEEFIKNQYIK